MHYAQGGEHVNLCHTQPLMIERRGPSFDETARAWVRLPLNLDAASPVCNVWVGDSFALERYDSVLFC